MTVNSGQGWLPRLRRAALSYAPVVGDAVPPHHWHHGDDGADQRAHEAVEALERQSSSHRGLLSAVALLSGLAWIRYGSEFELNRTAALILGGVTLLAAVCLAAAAVVAQRSLAPDRRWALLYVGGLGLGASILFSFVGV